MESELCQYCGMSGAHSPECPTQFKAEKKEDGEVDKIVEMSDRLASIFEMAKKFGKDYLDEIKDELEDLATESIPLSKREVTHFEKSDYPGWTAKDFASLLAMIKKVEADKKEK